VVIDVVHEVRVRRSSDHVLHRMMTEGPATRTAMATVGSLNRNGFRWSGHYLHLVDTHAIRSRTARPE
jgi:hypothetical protein